MKNQFFKPTLMIGALLVIAGLLLASCGGAQPDAETQAPGQVSEPTSPPAETESPQEPAAPPEPELAGDAVRGGLLYDKWWVVIAEEEEEEHVHADEHAEEAGHAPEGDHPLWATQSTNTRSGTDTWRCKECHGWDYKGKDGAYGSGSHFTGFVGVFDSKDKPANDVLAALQGSTSPDHDFSSVMDEQDLVDLALFLTTALVDYDTLINADKTSLGDAAAGSSLYEEVCIKCHGPGGNAINFAAIDDPEFLGHLAPDNPWEFAHKVRFGQPGWPMPSGIRNGWTDQDVANVLAYAQSFRAEPALSEGGKLYDNWWETLGLEAPESDNPLWATQTTNTRSGADTWRCKECHGWDYLGVEGAYGSGSHATGFTGILGASTKSSDELLSWLTGGVNPDHDFSAAMEAYALDALVAFIQNEAEDIRAYVNADGSVNGDPANGKELFDGTCASCHGVDGKKMNFGSAEEPEYVGTVAADNPWEFFHKASFGQPGAPMPQGRALGWVMEQIANLLAYSQTLPTE